MRFTTVSSRKFNQDVSEVKRAALNGPVFITDRGHTAHVLLSIKDYERMTGKKKSIVALLAMPDSSDIEFDPPRLKKMYKREDLL